MPLDPELLALRYSERPGCRFVGFREVAIPIFFMNLRAVLARERTLPTVDEFILRCVQLGVCDLRECAALLGLAAELVEQRVIQLRTQELVAVDATTASVMIRLTATGLLTATKLGRRELVEETLLRIPVHGWTRQPINSSERETLSQKEADDLGLQVLRPVPARHPEAPELDAHLLTKALEHSRGGRLGRLGVTEVLAIQGVLKKGVRLRYLPALMIQWQVVGGKKYHIGFVADGKLDEQLEKSFVAIKGLDVFADLFADSAAPFDPPVDGLLPVAIRARVKNDLVPESESRALNQITAALANERQDVHSERDLARPDTKQVQKERIEELEAQMAAEKSKFGKRSRSIWTPEIRELFLQALSSAKKRLVIVSAFVGDTVVNEDFIRSLEACVHRGAHIYLLIGDENMVEKNIHPYKLASRNRALERIELLFQKYKQFVHVEFRNHHAKMLICDDEYAVCGSYNFLSFDGRNRKGKMLRAEQAILLQDPVAVDEVGSDLMKQFFNSILKR